ncbi:MAG TPA: EAL domain-containing protein [Solirubrobacteraceae bacterium]|nr:EAL domain-containing protein [Solirubrobacteraceae bacterium]
MEPWVAEEDRLAVLRRTQLLDLPPEPDLDRWTAVLRSDAYAAAAAFVLADATHMFIKSLSTADGFAEETHELALSESLAEYLLGVVHPRATDDGPPAYAQAAVTVEGQLLGWMAIADDAGREWAAADMRALEGVAGAVRTEVMLRLANQEASRSRNLVESHNRVHELIAQAAPLSDVLIELVEGIERYEPSVIPCVVLLDRTTNTLRPGAGPSLPPHYLAAINGVVIGPNVGTCGSAAWSGKLVVTDDIATDPKWAPVRDLAAGSGLGHCWSMPVKATSGEVLGTLALYGPRPRHPLPEHLALMRAGAGLAGIAIERQRAMERLVHDASHDGLTGLPNRAAIFERLDDALVDAEPEAECAVLFIDLDGLKALNDTLGHDRADEVLREIGVRLSAVVRADDLVGRFGGDEFVVVAEGASHQQAAELGARLLETISKPIDGTETTVITASVGIAMIRGSATDAREAIREADSAMYAAKRAGRDGYSFFKGQKRMRPQRALSLAHALRGADTRGELSLVFQPVFDFARSELVAVEALPLWKSPTFGEVSAAEFIPIAEESGTIVSLGAWMLREGCETLARIGAQIGRPLELGVNITAHQLAEPGFAHSVHQTLKHSEFPVELLTLEITESATARPGAVAARALGELDLLGVRVVLDDFGTGYSSLQWLKEHPRHGIKIASGFVSDLAEDVGSRAVVAAVIGMAKALGCTVTALGVDTDTQLAALLPLGCMRGQGAVFGPPVTAHELLALLG